MNLSLFGDDERLREWREDLFPGAVVLRRFALAKDMALLAALDDVLAVSPFRESFTPAGQKMSVRITGCGEYGAGGEADNYVFRRVDPLTKKPWPAMPPVIREIGIAAATEAGFPAFQPNACHVNQYAPGAKLGMHQDRGEEDLVSPIVSISLGLSCVFKMGGFERSGKSLIVPLAHGDVVVWGGPSRMRFHGVLPVKADFHPLTGEYRINMTIRKVA